MSVILLVLGIVLALAGIATVGFGIPINEMTFVVAGTTALTGGLVLVGLSAVVSELARVAEGLKTRPNATRPAARGAEPEVTTPAIPASPMIPAAPAPAPAASARPLQDVIPTSPPLPPPPRPRPPEPPARELRPPEPYPAPPAAANAPSAVDVSSAAIERLRSSIPRTERSPMVADVEDVPLSPNGAVQQPSAPARRTAAERTAAEIPAPEPRVNAEDRAAGTAAETLKASRLDFLFRSKPNRPAAAPQQAENFEALWPSNGRQPAAGRPTALEPQAQPRAEQIERQSDAAPAAVDRHIEPALADEPRSAAILKSGVVDGMAYTLYADGSIEAKLPHGTVRFGSIAELRAHIESNS
jgi:hypothetical protein